MGPPPSASRGKVSRTRRGTTEFGSQDHMAMKASGLYQTTTVQDRIKQWQMYGAACTPVPDTLSSVSAPLSQASDISEPQIKETQVRNKRQTEEESDIENRKPDSQWQVNDGSYIQASVAPHKRVVSDGHWRTRRSSKREVHFNAQDEAGMNALSPELSVPKTCGEKSVKDVRTEREERRQRRINAQTSRLQGNKTRLEHDDGDQKLKTASVTIEAHVQPQHRDRYVDANEDGRTEISQASDDEPASDGSRLELDESHGVWRPKTRYIETLGRLPSVDQRDQLKSRKGSFLTKTKEVLGISVPTPVPSSRLPSIQAWLEDQPDPHIEVVRRKENLGSVCSSPSKKRTTRPEALKSNPASPDRTRPSGAFDGSNVLGRKNSGDNRIPEISPKGTPDGVSLYSASLNRRSAKMIRTKPTTTLAPVWREEDLPRETVFDVVESSHKGPAEHEPLTRRPTRLSTTASVAAPKNQFVDKIVTPDDDQHRVEGKITKSEDMIAVLSRSPLRKSSRKSRGVGMANRECKTASVKQVLADLAEDQVQFSRELRTLVDGVIPVLLQCVLSRSDAVAAAELFTTSPDNPQVLSFSRPIIEMGIALERLKTLHNRLPLDNVDRLLSWCQTAHKAYSQYLKAWRLGFQDIVVNLAPLEGVDGENSEVMERDEKGDIVNSRGETVDIAYLMKRPLVNIRTIGRVLSTIQEELPEDLVAEKVAEEYRELAAAAKIKHQQEKGRLEDEAAANTDTSRCRDIRDLAPFPGALIDKKKRVRARDCFNMTLFHSTGQRMDCKVELMLRDNNQNSEDGGDLLICQIGEADKWLLFAPVDLSQVSARKGESGYDLVIMIRGRAGMAQEWRELLALQVDEIEAASEWMLMLGSNPLPPKLKREPSLKSTVMQEWTSREAGTRGLTKSVLRRVPSTSTIDIPIGEPSVLGVAVPSREEKLEYESQVSAMKKPMSQLSMGGGLLKKDIPGYLQVQSHPVSRKPNAAPIHTSNRSTISSCFSTTTSTFAPSSLAPMDYVHPHLQKKGKTQISTNRYDSQTISLPVDRSTRKDRILEVAVGDHASSDSDDLSTDSKIQNSYVEVGRKPALKQSQPLVDNLTHAHIIPPAPSVTFAPLPKTRRRPSTSTPLTNIIGDTWSNISGMGRKTAKRPAAEAVDQASEVESSSVADKPAEEQNRRNDGLSPEMATNEYGIVPPTPPRHKVMPVLERRRVLEPSAAQIKNEIIKDALAARKKKKEARKSQTSHSPLRYQYNPSSASASEQSGSGPPSSTEDDSQTSEDDQNEHHDGWLPQKPVPPLHACHTPIGAQQTVTTTGTRTVAPSDSASQGPYRRVPSSANHVDAVKKRAEAMICLWNPDGIWEPIVEGYCSIVLSPGLLEAFVVEETQSNDGPVDQRPLVAFELTPLVLLRKGTGLDISFKSPPTAESEIKTSSNVMFRSRTSTDCEELYQMINWSRCHNQTYIELERARPRPQPAVTFNMQEAPKPRSWFSFGGVRRRGSYRVGNIPPSSMGESQATTRTASSAMSALKRLTQSSSFNVTRSSVLKKNGMDGAASMYSSSRGTGVDSNTSTPPPSQLGMIPGTDGPNVPPTSDAALNGGGMVHNMKIRLSVRESNSWSLKGSGRLSILPAVKHNDGPPEGPLVDPSDVNPAGNNAGIRRASTGNTSTVAPQRQYRLSSSYYTPHRLHSGGREKRVVVTKENNLSHVLLDATLGETCFERVSPLGIAVQVWTATPEVKSRGSVLLGGNTTYMLQFHSAKECAWVFELVGRYRYD